MTCTICNKELPVPRTYRHKKRIYCGNICKDKAYKERLKQLHIWINTYVQK